MKRTSRLIEKPEFWRLRAQETRALADRETDDETKRSLLETVAEYERLAKLADRRLN